MLPLCLDQGVGVIPWSPLARGKLARPWDAETTKRSESDGYAKSLYAKTAEADQRVVERLGELAESAWSSAGAGGPGVAADQTGHHCTHCGRNQAASSG